MTDAAVATAKGAAVRAVDGVRVTVRGAAPGDRQRGDRGRTVEGLGRVGEGEGDRVGGDPAEVGEGDRVGGDQPSGRGAGDREGCRPGGRAADDRGDGRAEGDRAVGRPGVREEARGRPTTSAGQGKAAALRKDSGCGIQVVGAALGTMKATGCNRSQRGLVHQAFACSCHRNY